MCWSVFYQLVAILVLGSITIVEEAAAAATAGQHPQQETLPAEKSDGDLFREALLRSPFVHFLISVDVNHDGELDQNEMHQLIQKYLSTSFFKQDTNLRSSIFKTWSSIDYQKHNPKNENWPVSDFVRSTASVLFEAADANHDGHLQYTDLVKLFQTLYINFDAAFPLQLMDFYKDGQISLKEFQDKCLLITSPTFKQ